MEREGPRTGPRAYRALRLARIREGPRAGRRQHDPHHRVDPLAGRADSGQLDADLAVLCQELGDTERTLGSGMLITLDEIQYLMWSQLSALIVGLHHVSQRGLPVMVAAAGLPSMPGLAGEARSYAERLITYVDIGSLTSPDARRALVEPVEAEGASWSSNALKQALSDTDGYPYFLQEFGKHAWNVADGPAITAADMRSATMLATDALDVGFFRARIDKTTDSEREHLRAMASPHLDEMLDQGSD
jgi:hypothetical protein